MLLLLVNFSLNEPDIPLIVKIVTILNLFLCVNNWSFSVDRLNSVEFNNNNFRADSSAWWSVRLIIERSRVQLPFGPRRSCSFIRPTMVAGLERYSYPFA